MKKLYKPPIPPEEIPEGVRLCIKNCKRLWNDAKLLYDKEGHSSAILLLILAREEFAKALLLLNHEKDGVDDKTVKEYFGYHLIRLEEFQKFFERSIGSSIDMTWKGSFDKEDREKYTYVDWTQTGWSYPEYKPPKHWNLTDDSVFDKQRVESFMADLKQVFWKLEKDPNYQTVIQKESVNRPDGDKLLTIIKEVTGLSNPTSNTEIKQTKIKIIVDVLDTSKKTEFETKMKQKILEKFPVYKVDIIIRKKKN